MKIKIVHRVVERIKLDDLCKVHRVSAQLAPLFALFEGLGVNFSELRFKKFKQGTWAEWTNPKGN